VPDREIARRIVGDFGSVKGSTLHCELDMESM
jgi:hypothetical protein